jgi:hypothetical protein
MEAESVPIEGSLETSHLLEQVKDQFPTFFYPC